MNELLYLWYLSYHIYYKIRNTSHKGKHPLKLIVTTRIDTMLFSDIIFLTVEHVTVLQITSLQQYCIR